MRRLYRFCWALILGMGWGCLSATALAQVPGSPTITGQGSAQVRNGDLALARWQATADALKNAIESHGATVRSGTLMSNGKVFETLRIQSDIRTRDVTVLEEKRQGEQLTITVQATIDDGAPSTDSPSADCSRGYRKRVVFTALPLQRPTQLKRGEVTNLPSSLAQLLAAAADRSGKLEALAEPGISLLAGDNPQVRPEQLTALLARQRAQVVVAGVVRNFYPVKDAGLLGMVSLGEPDRLLELDLQVLGPLEEGPMTRKQFSFRLPGMALTGAAGNVGSEAFAASPFGLALAQAMDVVNRWLEESVLCSPYTARVLQADGGRLLLDAGSQGGLKEGDGVIVFRLGQGNGLAQPLASATVRKTQADRATAEVGHPGGALAVRAGDVVVGQ